MLTNLKHNLAEYLIIITLLINTIGSGSVDFISSTSILILCILIYSQSKILGISISTAIMFIAAYIFIATISELSNVNEVAHFFDWELLLGGLIVSGGCFSIGLILFFKYGQYFIKTLVE